MAEKTDKYLCRLKEKLILILRSQQILVSELTLRLLFTSMLFFIFQVRVKPCNIISIIGIRNSHGSFTNCKITISLSCFFWKVICK